MAVLLAAPEGIAPQLCRSCCCCHHSMQWRPNWTRDSQMCYCKILTMRHSSQALAPPCTPAAAPQHTVPEQHSSTPGPVLWRANAWRSKQRDNCALQDLQEQQDKDERAISTPHCTVGACRGQRMSHWQIWAKQWLNQQHRIHTRPILVTGKESSGQGQQQWVWDLPLG